MSEVLVNRGFVDDIIIIMYILIIGVFDEIVSWVGMKLIFKKF